MENSEQGLIRPASAAAHYDLYFRACHEEMVRAGPGGAEKLNNVMGGVGPGRDNLKRWWAGPDGGPWVVGFNMGRSTLLMRPTSFRGPAHELWCTT